MYTAGNEQEASNNSVGQIKTIWNVERRLQLLQFAGVIGKACLYIQHWEYMSV